VVPTVICELRPSHADTSLTAESRHSCDDVLAALHRITDVRIVTDCSIVAATILYYVSIIAVLVS